VEAVWRIESARIVGTLARLTGDDIDDIDDDVLALMIIACHPVLSREAQVALTLRVVGGLTSDAIARAFLVPTATMQARITRAKKTIAAARCGSRCLHRRSVGSGSAPCSVCCT
jgi:predicted RNA polymerase sigma factor